MHKKWMIVEKFQTDYKVYGVYKFYNVDVVKIYAVAVLCILIDKILKNSYVRCLSAQPFKGLAENDQHARGVGKIHKCRGKLVDLNIPYITLCNP